ncbi:helix-turn-helix domain-containing protein [Carnobacterium maltaromaticum]|uniref:helix-turn-helix domain-containing protein n=1 Tax=Carnobacterium maltaromaticum TaxID=2751 RepID=UPI0039AFC195
MDKIINRKIKLIQLLYSYTTYTGLQEIADSMGLTIKTIQLELSEIVEQLNLNDYGIKLVNAGANYYLEREAINHIDLLYFSLEKESLFFFFTNKLFYNQLNPKKLYEIYHYSYSHFHKRKIEYGNHLRKYDLSFSSKPLSIVGSEMMIRFYFFSFYWEKYGKIEWPFSHVEKKWVLSLVRKIEEDTQLSLSEIEQLKLAYWLAVILNRTLNSHFIADSQFVEQQSNYIIHQKNVAWRELFFDDINQMDSRTVNQELIYLMSILLLVLDGKKNKEFFTQKQIYYQFGDVIDLSLKFCQSVQGAFQLKSGIEWELMLNSVYRVFYCEMKLSGKGRNEKEEYNVNKNASTYKLFIEKYQKFCLDLMETNEQFRSFINVSELWEELMLIVLQVADMNLYRPSLTAQIKLAAGNLEERLLMDYLNQLDYRINYEIDGKNSVDIVITDIYSEQSNHIATYFPWNTTSTQDNFKRLSHFLKEFKFTR